MSSPSTVAQCCFADVGQGSCSIILLGDRKAIVIDAGPRRTLQPVRLLEHFHVDYIEALIITHNDRDHWGGAHDILRSFGRAIESLYFLEDRPTDRNMFFDDLLEAKEEGAFQGDIRRLECDAGTKGKVVYRNNRRQLELHVLFPSMWDNIAGRGRERPNATSGILALQCGKRRIIFSGDAGYDQWRRLTGDRDRPAKCDVLAVPHHGGDLAPDKPSDTKADCHRWIYQRAVRSRYNIVSVGTSNQHKHPRKDHIAAIRQSGGLVLCTQITQQCWADLEGLRPGVARSGLPGDSAPHTSLTQHARRSRRVACAGSILVDIGPETVSVSRLAEHQAAVDALAETPGGKPLCRP